MKKLAKFNQENFKMVKLKTLCLVLFSFFICAKSHAVTNESVIVGATTRLEELAKSFQVYGPEEVFQISNGTKNERNYQNHPLGPLVLGDTTTFTNGGPAVFIEDNKIAATGMNGSPYTVKQDVRHDPLIQAVIAALKADQGDEKVVVYYPNRDKPEQIVVAWGRKALMGSQLDKTKHTLFCAFISFKPVGR